MMTNPKKEFYQNTAVSLILIVCIAIAFDAVRRHDESVISGRYSLRSNILQDPISPSNSTADERRIAALFAADTLPALMEKGLVKKYRRTGTATVLTVSGNLWKQRSLFFKNSLLSALFVYNKVNSYAPHVHIVDDRSGRLYAEIVSHAEQKLYN